jgi:predicted nucleic acid-binding protein
MRVELWHERRFELVISDELLEEVDQVLRRKKLRALHRRSDPEIDTLMKDLKTAIRVVPVSDIDVPALAGRDPDDLVVVATGKAGRWTIL